jgi:hypothetical protein
VFCMFDGRCLMFDLLLPVADRGALFGVAK